MYLPRPGAYPLVVNPVICQIRLARVLIDGGSALNIIFTKTLEDMGFNMTKLVPSDQAFYGIIPGAGSTSVSKVTLPSPSVPVTTTARSPSSSRWRRSRPPTTLYLGD